MGSQPVSIERVSKMIDARHPCTPDDLFGSPEGTEGYVHPRFRLLRDRAELMPARWLVARLHRDEVHCMRPAFIEHFRGQAFDLALFELFLVAMFKAAGHRVALRQGTPVLLLEKADTTAAVDAFTVGRPAVGIEPESRWGAADAREGAVESLGGRLFRSLHQGAWRTPRVDGCPYVIAVQDFDHVAACGAAPPSLVHFLFGGGSAPSQELGDLFPNGFFGHKGGEYVSGVLFCNGGNIAKFNRLGQQAHEIGEARMLRHGACVAEDPCLASPQGYAYEVGPRGTRHEQWNEGTVLIHNPFALHPLPADWLGAAAEMRCTQGQPTQQRVGGEFFPFSSTTELLRPDTPSWWVEERRRLLEREETVHPRA